MTNKHGKKDTIGPPEKWNTLFEGPIACRDYFLSSVERLEDSKNLPKGDGHPVLLLPGFLASDGNMLYMKKFLNNMNYKAEPWQGGVNWGPSDDRLEHLKKRLKQIYTENNNQKVSLIGWSLGGIYARKLAQEFPEMVRDVISLGSPFQAINNPNSTIVGALFSKINPDIKPDKIFDPSLPIEAPMTSIYTKNDGVVNWEACLLKEDFKTENISVDSSHMGLIFNRDALTIIANRLSQPEGQWKKHAQPKAPLSKVSKTPKK